LEINIKDINKVIFAGLDNGGKTSILLLLNKKFSLLSSIKPTFKAKRALKDLSLLGTSIVNWDLGGQESYRSDYLKNKEKYFLDVRTIFYVIDIQDSKRFNEALDYLKRILDALRELEIQFPNFLILFHKCDPDIKNSEKIIKNIENLKEKIKASDLNIDFSFYKTSIFDEPSILKAFSDGVISVSAKAKMIQSLLKEYTGKTFNSAAVLLDRQGFIIGSRATKPEYETIIEETAPRFIQTIEKLEEWKINPIDIVTNIEFPLKTEENTREGIIFMRKLDINEERLYIVSLCLNKKIKIKSYEYLPILAENIKNLLEKFE